MNEYWDVPAGRLQSLLSSHIYVAIVSTAAKLDIADAFTGKLMTPASVAVACGLDPSLTARLLAGMDDIGLLVDYDDELYDLSDTGQLLRSDHPRSLKNWASIQSDVMMPLVSGLAQTVRTGEPSDATTVGKPFYQWLADNPELNRRWNLAMAETARAWFAEAIIDSVDWSEVETLVDVGGGTGAVAIGLAQRFAHLRVTICDLPAVAEQATAAIAAVGLADRVSVVVGDYTNELPAADVMLLVRVACNLNDGAFESLAARCRRVSNQLIVVDGVQTGAATADLLMATLGGRLRSLAAWGELLGRAGWSLKTTEPGTPPWATIVCQGS